MTDTDLPNAVMRQHWSEVAGPRWVRDRERYDAALEPFVEPLLAAAGAAVGMRVLDAGCGFGTTTLALANQVGPTGRVVGVDISAPMLAELERRAAERPDGAPIEAVLADLQTAALPGPFDLVVSRFGVMFFDDPATAWRNMHGVTGTGGRLAFVCWQRPQDNPWSSLPAQAALAVSASDVPLPGPCDPGASSLAEPTRVRTLLGDAGWREIELVDLRPEVTLGRDLDDAMQHLANNMAVAGAIERAGAAAVLPAVRAALEPYVDDDGAVRLASAAWLVTATA